MKRQRDRVKKALIGTLLELPVVAVFPYAIHAFSQSFPTDGRDLLLYLALIFLMIFWQYQFRVFFYRFVKPSGKAWINLLRYLSYIIWAMAMVWVHMILALITLETVWTIFLSI